VCIAAGRSLAFVVWPLPWMATWWRLDVAGAAAFLASDADEPIRREPLGAGNAGIKRHAR
jgi:hypothetical protein